MKSHITTYYLEEALLSQINTLNPEATKKSLMDTDNLRETVQQIRLKRAASKNNGSELESQYQEIPDNASNSQGTTPEKETKESRSFKFQEVPGNTQGSTIKHLSNRQLVKEACTANNIFDDF